LKGVKNVLILLIYKLDFWNSFLMFWFKKCSSFFIFFYKILPFDSFLSAKSVEDDFFGLLEEGSLSSSVFNWRIIPFCRPSKTQIEILLFCDYRYFMKNAILFYYFSLLILKFLRLLLNC
jgi:hypothetical protein